MGIYYVDLVWKHVQFVNVCEVSIKPWEQLYHLKIRKNGLGQNFRFFYILQSHIFQDAHLVLTKVQGEYEYTVTTYSFKVSYKRECSRLIILKLKVMELLKCLSVCSCQCRINANSCNNTVLTPSKQKENINESRTK